MCELFPADFIAKVHLYVFFDAVIEGCSLDEEMSYYDREEKDYLFKQYDAFGERHSISFEAVIECEYDIEKIKKRDKCEIFCVDEEESDRVINLSKWTYKDVLYEELMIREKEMVWNRNNAVCCSQCGRFLGFTTNGCFFKHDREPLCETCACTDDRGFICPNCGLKYPYDQLGNSGSFCIDCEIQLDA